MTKIDHDIKFKQTKTGLNKLLKKMDKGGQIKSLLLTKQPQIEKLSR